LFDFFYILDRVHYIHVHHWHALYYVYITLCIFIYCRHESLLFVSASRWQVGLCFPRHGESTEYSPRNSNEWYVYLLCKY